MLDIAEKLKEVALQFKFLNSNERLQEDLLKVQTIIERNPLILPHLLTLCSVSLIKFQDKAKKMNDHLMREALGDAVHLLGMKRKPSDMKRMCTRIKEAIFPLGINTSHHRGEINFYEKYLEEKEEK